MRKFLKTVVKTEKLPEIPAIRDEAFFKLWDLYNPLLTDKQKETTNLYFNYDLSLGEIAEQKGVSRQSVFDCLKISREQLEKYEEKLGFANALQDVSLEFSAYLTDTQRFLEKLKQKYPQTKEDIDDFIKESEKESEKTE